MDENQRWREYCHNKFFDANTAGNLEDFLNTLQELQSKPGVDNEILKQLEIFASSKQWIKTTENDQH
jgi:hypothetical protein